VLLKPTGDAPIMKKRKWTVERTKKISSVIDFVRKYLKFEPQESLVSSSYYWVSLTRFVQYGDSAGSATEENSSIFSLTNVLVAVSKGMRAVKLSSNKILQLLTGALAQNCDNGTLYGLLSYIALHYVTLRWTACSNANYFFITVDGVLIKQGSY